MTTKTTKTTVPAETSLVLRVSGPAGESHNGFVWPLTVGAEVICPDWEDNSECGKGLHGWLYGKGDHSAAGHWDTEGAKWLVLEVASADIRMLGGKVKFPRCTVRFVGSKSDAAAFIIANEPRSATVAVIGATIANGDNEAAAVGALGTATAGYRGTATAGDSGTATAGDSGTISIRYWDSKADRYRVVIGYIGEDGLEANVAYHLDENHKFVKVAS